MARHDITFRNGAKRAQHLHLFVADRGRIQIGGRLHRGQGKQLQHVVLHHVTQRTGIFIKAGTPFQTNGFADRDLDMLDRVCVPQGFEKHVRKAQRHEVLHRFLAQIMVNPEGAAFGKNGVDCIVDRPA